MVTTRSFWKARPRWSRTETEVDAVDGAWSEKYVDPGTGTRDTVRAPDVEVWRVDPSHVMTWAYGDISNRTDWRDDS